MSGLIGGAGSKSGVIGRGKGGGTQTTLWSGTETGGATNTITVLNMSSYSLITIIFGDGTFIFHTIPYTIFALDSAGTHGHMLCGYDTEHIYAKYINDTTIKVFDGSAGCAIRRVVGTT